MDRHFEAFFPDLTEEYILSLRFIYILCKQVTVVLLYQFVKFHTVTYCGKLKPVKTFGVVT